MLLNKEVKEKKTGKRREVKINREFQTHSKDCYQELAIKLCLISNHKIGYSTQWVNLILKEH